MICARFSTTTCWRGEGYGHRRRLSVRAGCERPDLRRRRTLEAGDGLLARCAEGAVSGILPFAALLEVCHKLMLIEARAGNRISGSNPARKLSAQPEVVKSLHAYRAKVDALLNSSI